MKISECFVSKKTACFIKQLYTEKDAGRMIKKLGVQRSLIFAVIAALSVTASIPVFIMDATGLSEPVTSIDRNEYGKGSRTVTVSAVTDDGYEEKMVLEVNERQYTEDELERFSKEIDDSLWKVILASNSDADHVTEDLDLKEYLEGYPFEIRWRSDKPLILSGDGKINTDKLSEYDPENEGVQAELCASLKYRDFSEDKYSYVVIRKKELSSEEAMKDMITDAIRQNDDDSRSRSSLILPDRAEKNHVRFYMTRTNRGWAVMMTGMAAAFILLALKDGRIKDEAVRRRKQMDRDYPRIVNQYALYHTAGMNPRAIWNAMCERYEISCGKTEKNRRYAYEEMIMARRMMDEGKGELSAYDQFALRCQGVKFRSFISFVKQAVIRGNEGLDEMLYGELEKAQREKSLLVKTEASEAETKLLIPMFMMLLVVLAFVLIPAFTGLNS